MRTVDEQRAHHRAYMRKWNAANRDKVSVINQARYKKRKRKLDEIKLTRGCVDCGYSDYAGALSFDHVRGIKAFDIGAKILGTWEGLLREIAKCEVRCLNCHAVKTKQRRGSVTM